MSDDPQQTDGHSALITIPKGSAVKSFLAPVVVAVVVGMGTAYLTATEALARFDERQQAQARAIEAIEGDVDDLAQLTSQIDRLSWQIDRLEEKLDEAD